jgi:hypothetical protein
VVGGGEVKYEPVHFFDTKEWITELTPKGNFLVVRGDRNRLLAVVWWKIMVYRHFPFIQWTKRA